MTISPVDSSLYTNFIDSIGTFPSRESLVKPVQAAYQDAEEFSEPLNLGDYFSNIANSDLLTEVANNVAQSEKQLNNVIMEALENGMGVEDAVKINKALNAYNANCRIAQSTFELKV